MSDADEHPGKQTKVILPAGPPELTPAVARALLALLIELSDKKVAQAAKPQVPDQPSATQSSKRLRPDAESAGDPSKALVILSDQGQAT